MLLCVILPWIFWFLFSNSNYFPWYFLVIDVLFLALFARTVASYRQQQNAEYNLQQEAVILPSEYPPHATVVPASALPPQYTQSVVYVPVAPNGAPIATGLPMYATNNFVPMGSYYDPNAVGAPTQTFAQPVYYVAQQPVQ